jgi:hypothetical protein
MGGAVVATGALPVEKYRYTPAMTSTTPNKIPTIRALNIFSPVVLFVNSQAIRAQVVSPGEKVEPLSRASLRFLLPLCTLEIKSKEYWGVVMLYGQLQSLGF